MTTFAYTGGALSNLVGNTPGANVSNVVTLLNDLKTFLNAPNLDGTNIADIPESLLALAVQQKLGLNDGGQIGRGKSIIATQEARTNTAYGLLTTPDRVENVVLPTDGLLFVAYQAMFMESIDGTATAAIFIGANQLKTQLPGTGPTAQDATVVGGAGNMVPLSTCATGLEGAIGTLGATTSDVTTGQAVAANIGATGSPGGPCTIFAAAGTYTVSVQFKATSGTVTAKERKLWVWTIGF